MEQIMKVYVVYEDYGHEGCTAPLKVFSTEEKADSFVKMKNEENKWCYPEYIWDALEVE